MCNQLKFHNVENLCFEGGGSSVQEWRNWIRRERVCNGLNDPIELLVPLTLVLPGVVESFRFLLDSAEQGLAAGGGASKEDDATYITLEYEQISAHLCPS